MTPKHARACANCRHTGPLPDGWRWCCWFPIGCQCAVTPKPATEETMAVHDCGTCTCLPEPLRVPMQTLDVIGLTDDEMDPTDAIQFGVRVPHPDLGHITHVYGDQSWVAYGKCIEDGTYPDGQIVYRTITIAYGEWQSA